MSILNTTPNSEPGNSIFDDALASKNLYRIGIAAHAFADTWAHQNFLGCKHFFCSLKGMLALLMPNIGHADAGKKPDVPNLIWFDSRLCKQWSEVNNKKRFLEAAEVLFKKFCAYNGTADEESKWQELKKELDPAIGNESRNYAKCQNEKSERIKRYKQLCPEIKDYEEGEWLTDAIKIKSGQFGLKKTYFAKAGFENSNWYKFQEAVKQHQKAVFEKLKSRFDQIGLRDDWRF